VDKLDFAMDAAVALSSVQATNDLRRSIRESRIAQQNRTQEEVGTPQSPHHIRPIVKPGFSSVVRGGVIDVDIDSQEGPSPDPTSSHESTYDDESEAQIRQSYPVKKTPTSKKREHLEMQRKTKEEVPIIREVEPAMGSVPTQFVVPVAEVEKTLRCKGNNEKAKSDLDFNSLLVRLLGFLLLVCLIALVVVILS